MAGTLHPYWASVFRRAVQEKSADFKQKFLRGLATAVIAVLLQWYWFSLRNWTDTKKMVATLIGSVIAVTVVEFLWQFIRIPAVINEEQKTEILQANNTIQDLQKTTPITTEQRERRSLITDKIQPLTDDAKRFLKSIALHAWIEPTRLSNLGFQQEIVDEAMRLARTTALLEDDKDNINRVKRSRIDPLLKDDLLAVIREQIG